MKIIKSISINKNLKLTTSKITLVIIFLLMAAINANINWGKDNWKNIIEADGKGYYAYLPALFIYNDPNFDFFDKIEKGKYYNKDLFYDYRIGSHGATINKYYCGTAVAELPFFLAAHSLSYLLGFETDGYSKLYEIWISIGAVVYLLIGLIYLSATLRLYKINELQKSFVLLTAVFGTNLFTYTIVEPSLSHLYSFAFVSMFVYYAKSYFLFQHQNHLLFLAMLLAIILLIRPVNGLIIFSLPFLAGSLSSLKQGLLKALKYKLHLIGCFCIFTAIVAIQFIYYKIATGHFFVYSYGEEGFHFLNPHIINILFSYKKGLFLYTPIYLLSFAGSYFLYQSSKFQFYAWSLFFILITYVFSSWWMWFYGASFSSRVFVEYIPLFMILLAIALNKITSKSFRILFTSTIIVLIVICQIQTYQYRYYAIHYSDMTKEKYWDNFLRIDRLIKLK